MSFITFQALVRRAHGITLQSSTTRSQLRDACAVVDVPRLQRSVADAAAIGGQVKHASFLAFRYICIHTYARLQAGREAEEAREVLHGVVEARERIAEALASGGCEMHATEIRRPATDVLAAAVSFAKALPANSEEGRRDLAKADAVLALRRAWLADDWPAVAAAAKAAGDLEVARPEVAAAREMLKHRGDVESCAAGLTAGLAASDKRALRQGLDDARRLGMTAEGNHCGACLSAAAVVAGAGEARSVLAAAEREVWHTSYRDDSSCWLVSCQISSRDVPISSPSFDAFHLNCHLRLWQLESTPLPPLHTGCTCLGGSRRRPHRGVASGGT